LILLLILLVFGAGALVGGQIAAVLMLAPIALFLYVWRIIFPFFRSIAEWLTNRMNCLPFFLFMFIITDINVGLLTIWLILLPDHPAVIWLILPLLPILQTALLIIFVALQLVLIARLVRLNQHAFVRFRTWFLTTAFRIVMWRARRRQEREEKQLQRPKKRVRRLRRRQKKEQPEDRE